MFFDTTLFGSYELAVALKLFLGALAGGIVGLEREKHGRPAGLRTHLLVSLGACLMMVISEAFYLKYVALNAESTVRLDPSRTAAQIVAGIGFLGAGVILKEGINVRGLTTAASLWVAAGLGMAFGMGLFGPGAMATGLALIGLLGLKRLEPLIKKDRFLFLTVTSKDREGVYEELEKLFDERGLRISDISAQIDIKEGEVIYDFILAQHRKRIGRELSTCIARIEGVKKIRFR